MVAGQARPVKGLALRGGHIAKDQSCGRVAHLDTGRVVALFGGTILKAILCACKDQLWGQWARDPPEPRLGGFHQQSAQVRVFIQLKELQM